MADWQRGLLATPVEPSYFVLSSGAQSAIIIADRSPPFPSGASSLSKKSQADLIVRLNGPGVGQSRLAARDFAKILSSLERGLQQVAAVLGGELSRRPGPPRKAISEACSFDVISYANGSAVIGLTLAARQQSTFLPDVGEASFAALLDGLALILEGGDVAAPMPHGFDIGVVQSCEALGAVLDHGINKIEISDRRRDRPTFTYTQAGRARIRARLVVTPRAGAVSKSGRLEVISGHDGIEGRLYEPDGSVWQCRFRPEHIAQLPAAWLKTIRVVGDIAGERVIDVHSLFADESAAEPQGKAGREDAGQFWQAVSIGDLAARQRVSPVSDPAELAEAWGRDDPLDDISGEICEDRESRRRAMRNRQARQ